MSLYEMFAQADNVFLIAFTEPKRKGVSVNLFSKM